MAKSDKQTPKYMRLTGKTQYELAQNIEAAMLEAEAVNAVDQNQACWQICYEQLLDQLQEEYGLDLSTVLPERHILDKHVLKQDILSMINYCGAQCQLLKPAKDCAESFKKTFKCILDRSLQDALDIMISKGIWRFDLQRTLQDIQKRVLHAVDQYPHT